MQANQGAGPVAGGPRRDRSMWWIVGGVVALVGVIVAVFFVVAAESSSGDPRSAHSDDSASSDKTSETRKTQFRYHKACDVWDLDALGKYPETKDLSDPTYEPGTDNKNGIGSGICTYATRIEHDTVDFKVYVQVWVEYDAESARGDFSGTDHSMKIEEKNGAKKATFDSKRTWDATHAGFDDSTHSTSHALAIAQRDNLFVEAGIKTGTDYSGTKMKKFMSSLVETLDDIASKLEA